MPPPSSTVLRQFVVNRLSCNVNSTQMLTVLIWVRVAYSLIFKLYVNDIDFHLDLYQLPLATAVNINRGWRNQQLDWQIRSEERIHKVFEPKMSLHQKQYTQVHSYCLSDIRYGYLTTTVRLFFNVACQWLTRYRFKSSGELEPWDLNKYFEGNIL